MRIIRPGTSGLTESLQASIDRMSKEYERAKRKALQDGLSARNQQISSFRRANMRKMEKLRSTKRESVMDKANVYLAEYGKKHGYGIIFGTAAGGSILYGDEDRYNITGEVPARVYARTGFFA